LKDLSIALKATSTTVRLLRIATRPRTRLAPDARREEILDHARELFGARSYAAVSASEIARAAGVTPALVSHYFPGGKRDIFLTLVAQLTEHVLETIRADPARPLRERVATTTENWLDFLEANSQTWLATAAQGDYIADPDLQALVDAARDRTVDTLINDYPDALTNDRRTRLMLRNWLGLNRAASRSWLKGEATRAETALLLTETLHHLITTVAPALKDLPGNGRALKTADTETDTRHGDRRRVAQR
jgi:AcrR family transcriptional regulator